MRSVLYLSITLMIIYIATFLLFQTVVKLNICRKHISKSGCSDPDHCLDLHCCRFHLMSKCQYGRRCRFGHDVRKSPHNHQVLRRLYADRVTVKCLRVLIRGETEAPPICKFYNAGGCRTGANGIASDSGTSAASKPSADCYALHVCKFYLKGCYYVVRLIKTIIKHC